MPFNGNGVYSLPAGNPVVANTTASSTVHNNTNSDIATALTNCVTKDGQSTPTANIPLGGFKLTNVGAATSVSDAVIASQIQNNGLTDLSSVSGTNTITATVTPVPSAYATGQVFTFEPANNNTGAATINISSLGAKDIYLNNAPLAADVLIAGQPVVIRYNGTQFEIIGKADFASLNAVSQTFAGSVSINNNTTLGDAAGDSVTFNAAAWSAPNGFAIDTTKLVLDSNSNFGLGVVPQSWSQGQAFEIDGAGNAIWGNSSGDIWMFANAYFNSGNFKYAASSIPSAYIRIGAASGNLAFGNAAAGTAGNNITFSDRLTINVNGLHFINNTGLPINNGFVSVQGDASNPPARLYQTGGDSAPALACDKSSSTNTTSQVFQIFTINNQSTGSGQINANGASQAAFGTFSDRTLKENIIDLGDELSNILSLRPVEFDYIESEGGGHQVGFIAQEVKEVYPDLIGERADGKMTLTGMAKMEARLIKAIQQQHGIIQSLTARIEALEAK